jgi:NADPH2:quinone reductase
MVATRAGGPNVLELQGRDEPECGPDRALVRVAYAGVNFADVVMRMGETGTPFPLVPGVEGSGTTADGQRVAWAPVKHGSSIGSYAETVAVHREQLLPLPDDIELETAASIALQGLTAHYLVHDIRDVGSGTTVLVHAGAGGTGRTVVQWLVHLGADVIVTVGSEEKADIARAAGASHAIVYTRDDFVNEVRAITDGRGVDYIVDGVVGTTFRDNLRAIADRGHIVVFGRAGGLPPSFSPLELLGKSVTVAGGMMSNFLRDRDEVLRKADDVWRGVRDGWLSPLVHRVLPLEDAATAHRLLEGRETVGKLVLAI